MRLDNVVIIGKREYLQRAKTKAFWITTLILPLFVSAISIVPTLLLSKSKTTQKIVVVDETGKVGSALVAKMNSQDARSPSRRRRCRGGTTDENVSFDAETEADGDGPEGAAGGARPPGAGQGSSTPGSGSAPRCSRTSRSSITPGASRTSSPRRR